MDENLKDILLVVLGSVASLLGGIIVNIQQARREMRQAYTQRRREDFEEIKDYLYHCSALYYGTVDYLFMVNRGLISASKEGFSGRVTPLSERVFNSRINGLPVNFITDNQAIAAKLATVYDYLEEFIKLQPTLYLGGATSLDVTQQHMENIVNMNRLIKDVLTSLEKEI